MADANSTANRNSVTIPGLHQEFRDITDFIVMRPLPGSWINAGESDANNAGDAPADAAPEAVAPEVVAGDEEGRARVEVAAARGGRATRRATAEIKAWILDQCMAEGYGGIPLNEAPPKKVLTKIFQKGKAENILPEEMQYENLRAIARTHRPPHFPTRPSGSAGREKLWIYSQIRKEGYGGLPEGEAPPKRILAKILALGKEDGPLTPAMSYEAFRHIARFFRPENGSKKPSIEEKAWIIDQLQHKGYEMDSMPRGRAPPRKELRAIWYTGKEEGALKPDISFEQVRHIARMHRHDAPAAQLAIEAPAEQLPINAD